MGNLKKLNLKAVYRTGKEDLYSDFYRPCLNESSYYDRAVGFFSSEILAINLRGIKGLVSSGGKMRLVIGHPLSSEEFEAVKHGNTLKQLQSDLSEKLVKMLTENSDATNRLQLLAWLIACGNLEIKFALRKAGMYHEKIGVFRDEHGNAIVFQGSANETIPGLMLNMNAESLSVYPSWEEKIFEAYGKEYIQGFESLWCNEQINVVTLEVPSSSYEKIAKQLAISVNEVRDLEEADDIAPNEIGLRSKSIPKVPEFIGGKPFELHSHQKTALKAWKANSYKGILKLATGAGKTLTSIYGAVKLYEAKKHKSQRLCFVVAVPYVELAKQWVDNLKLFNIFPLECFDSRGRWENDLENQINYFNANVSSFFCVVVVNKTLTSKPFQRHISNINENSLMFVGDECHHHGSDNVNNSLPSAFYRLGLSATPFRADDDEIDSPFSNKAKANILAYYGDIIAEYGLSDAINDGILTPYRYEIIPVYLTEEEQESYEEISSRISKILVKKDGEGLTRVDRENLTKLCGQRSRLLGGAKNKIISLSKVLAGFSDADRSHTLVYTGEGRPFVDESARSDENNQKVIDQILDVMISAGWRVSKFTSEVSKKDRVMTMSAFKQNTIDALVAMKVLDEGIDVPVCKTALILASTRNPRQYIQRRGRILRRAPDKDVSSIYDFVILPINDSPASKRLKAAEAERINDFAYLAINKLEIEQIIQNEGLSYDVT
jgi:superfamily II DNA or RNA helicase